MARIVRGAAAQGKSGISLATFGGPAECEDGLERCRANCNTGPRLPPTGRSANTRRPPRSLVISAVPPCADSRHSPTRQLRPHRAPTPGGTGRGTSAGERRTTSDPERPGQKPAQRHFRCVPSAGFEPAHTAPEATGLGLSQPRSPGRSERRAGEPRGRHDPGHDRRSVLHGDPVRHHVPNRSERRLPGQVRGLSAARVPLVRFVADRANFTSGLMKRA